MNTHIITCNCIHPYQDALYGTLKRVAKLVTKNGREDKCRCTVCGAVLPVPRS